MRNWRVWALAITMQAPSARIVAKAGLGAPVAIAVGLAIVSAIGLSALLRASRTRAAMASMGRPAGIIVVSACVLLVSALAYPRVQARSTIGAGSDEDDALIQTSRRLVAGERPLFVPTYLGNGVSAGALWAAALTPIVHDRRSYVLLTPMAFGLLAGAVLAAAGPEAAGLAQVAIIGSLWFWELLAAGSDLFAAGAVFVAAALLVRAAWMHSIKSSAPAAFGLAAAASARIVFAYVPLALAAFLIATRRRGAWLLVAIGVALVAVPAVTCWPDPQGVTPLHLVTKGVGVLGWTGVVALALATACATAVMAARLSTVDDLAGWMAALAVILVVPFGIIALADLAAFDVMRWPGPNDLAVALPSITAAVAVSLSGASYTVEH